MASSQNQALARTALVLPLHSQECLRSPSIYNTAIQQAVATTTKHISILFYDTSKNKFLSLLSPANDEAVWHVLQTFLGNVYAAAGHEAARHGRVLLDVDVLVEGMAQGVKARGVFDRVYLVKSDKSGEYIP